jgi:hypothetical protein
MFRFSIEETSSEERWTIQGRLAGAFAGELDAAWILSLQRRPSLSRVVDLSGVVSIDRRGEQVLRRMLSQNAKFIPCGVYTKHVLEKLRGQEELPLRDPHSPETS